MSDGLQMKYFVVKPKGTDSYAKASREAIKAYAKSIYSENQQLYYDLMAWAVTEDGAAREQEIGDRLMQQEGQG